jgi:hypothetical protein
VETALDPVPVDALTTLLSLSDTPFGGEDPDPELMDQIMVQMLQGPAIPVARFGSAI